MLLALTLGVPQRFYRPLAEWLVQEGFLVATFDCAASAVRGERRSGG